MLAFARTPGRFQGLAAQRGLGLKGFGQKGFGQKFLQPNLGQKPGFLQKFNQRFVPGQKLRQKYPEQR